MTGSPSIVEIKELNLDLIRPSTENMTDLETGGSKTIVVGKPGCFKKGTLVMMFDGSSKPVEDVKVGDKLMGDDSNCRVVLELCRNNDTMYEIIPEYGEPYTVNKKHKLVLIGSVSPFLGQIIEMEVCEYLSSPIEFKSYWHVFKASIDFDEIQVSNDPYKYGLGIVNDISNTNKDIDREYIFNSKHNRLELIAGICDSSNTTFTNNEFVVLHPSQTLRNNILYLCRSVGLRCINDNLSRKVIITGNIGIVPCRVKRVRVPSNNEQYISCPFTIKTLESDNYYGFTITGNHRFMLYSFDVVRNTGKTTLISSLLYAKKHIFPVGMAMSGSEDSNGFYRRIMPSTFVFNEFNEEKIKDFVRRQKIARQHLDNPWAVLLLDDCTDDPRIFNKPLMQGLYKRGRHFAMWFILSLQYAMDVKPVIRTNVDGIFILREPILKNRKTLWENYASIIPDFKLFCDLMDQITNDYTALFISNQSRSNDWKDCVFWYKAQPPPKDFKFGCEDYWKFHEERYNPEYVDPM